MDKSPRECLDFMLDSLMDVMENNQELLVLLMKENNRIVYGVEIDNFGKIFVKLLEQFNSEDCGINFGILSITIFNFFIVINYESFGMNKNLFLTEFKEYIARILQI